MINRKILKAKNEGTLYKERYQTSSKKYCNAKISTE